METRFFCFFLFFFPISNLASEVCPNTDLTKEVPISKRKNFFQSNMQWCCSFAAVDALSLKSGENISGIDIATKLASKTKQLEYCNFNEVIEAVNTSEGLCTEENYNMAPIFPDNFFLGKLSEQEIKNYFTGNQFKYETTKLESIFEFAKANPDFIKENCNSDIPVNSPMFRNIKNMRDIAQVLKFTIDKSFFDFLSALSTYGCTRKVKISIQHETLPFPVNDDSLRENSMNKIIHSLTLNQSPVIGIGTGELFKIPYDNRNWIQRLSARVNGDHVVNIVGSRSEGGKCFIKVRDSANGGLGCELMKKNPDIVCSPKEFHDQMTYEVEVTTLSRVTRDGFILK
jgi:hypothetical protein